MLGSPSLVLGHDAMVRLLSAQDLRDLLVGERPGRVPGTRSQMVSSYFFEKSSPMSSASAQLGWQQPRREPCFPSFRVADGPRSSAVRDLGVVDISSFL